MEKTLQTFIKALNIFLKHIEYKQFKVSEKQMVYLIENKSIISVLIRKDLKKNHIIVEEIFNTDSEKADLAFFCKKYYAEWVTFFKFNGTIMEERVFKGKPQYETILKKVPELELQKRYDEWEGTKTEFTVYKLEDYNKKGYALIKNQMFEKILNPSDIETSLVEFIREAFYNRNLTKEKYVIYKGFIEIIFDKEFFEIIADRYFWQIGEDESEIIYQIPDLYKFQIEDFTKEMYSIDVFRKLHDKKYLRQEITNEKPVYKVEIQSILPPFEERNKEYCYALVEFLDNPEKPLYYIAEDPEIKMDDLVLVGFDGFERLGTIIEIGNYNLVNVPYPVTKTRKIISKIDDISELKKYGLPVPDALLEDELDGDGDNDIFEEGGEEITSEINQSKEAYHIIKVSIKTKESALKIEEELFSKHLISSARLTSTESTYIWKNTPTVDENYKMEMMSRGDKLYQIKKIIEKLNDRKNARILGTEVNNMPEQMKVEINKYLDMKK